MERMEEKLKYLSEYGTVVSAFEFEGNSYFIAESGSLPGVKDGQKDFYLFDENGKHIGRMCINEAFLSETAREWERLDGVVDVPEHFFMLTDIDILRNDLHRKHLGSFLFNFGIREMERISAKTGETIPILFVRQNSEETLPFYEKWGAVLNQETPNGKMGSSCYMIIKNPTHQEKYDGKLLGRYEKTSSAEASKDGKDKK